jgi:hypothetical protein
MVYQGDPDRWSGGPKPLRPHDPAPDYPPATPPSGDWRWRAKARQSPGLVRVLTVILILLVAATVAIIVLASTTHH